MMFLPQPPLPKYVKNSTYKYLNTFENINSLVYNFLKATKVPRILPCLCSGYFKFIFWADEKIQHFFAHIHQKSVLNVRILEADSCWLLAKFETVYKNILVWLYFMIRKQPSSLLTILASWILQEVSGEVRELKTFPQWDSITPWQDSNWL